MANISLNLSLTGAIFIGSASAHGCHQPKYQWKNVRNETIVRKKNTLSALTTTAWKSSKAKIMLR